MGLIRRGIEKLPSHHYLVPWRLNAQPHLAIPNINDGDQDVAVDDDLIAHLPRQNQHRDSSLRWS